MRCCTKQLPQKWSCPGLMELSLSYLLLSHLHKTFYRKFCFTSAWNYQAVRSFSSALTADYKTFIFTKDWLQILSDCASIALKQHFASNTSAGNPAHMVGHHYWDNNKKLKLELEILKQRFTWIPYRNCSDSFSPSDSSSVQHWPLMSCGWKRCKKKKKKKGPL